MKPTRDELFPLGLLVVVWKPIPNSDKVRGYGFGIIVSATWNHFPNWDPVAEHRVLTVRGVLSCSHNELLDLCRIPPEV